VADGGGIYVSLSYFVWGVGSPGAVSERQLLQESKVSYNIYHYYSSSTLFV
jgi:hypothetical protein